MKNLILSVIAVMLVFIVFSAELSFAQTGSSPQKSQSPKVFKLSKKAKVNGKTNRGKLRYRYFVLTEESTKRKYRGKIDLSNVPPRLIAKR